MGCDSLPMPDGVAIICSRGKRTKRCAIEGCSRPAPYLCDFALTGRKTGKTCDRALCASHRREQPEKRDGDSVDLCPQHHEMTAAQGRLPLNEGTKT